MPSPFYANAGDSSSKKISNPSLRQENRLNLPLEHRDRLSQAFAIQLSRTALTPTGHRVLNAVYNQTIYFDKREDDINGKWFEHFMGVRNDHVNTTVRALEVLNILITRRGHYGKWVSINFDFDNWGKACPESQTNDPYFLLPKEYQPYLPQEELEFSLYRPPVAPEPTPPVVVTEPLDIPPSEPAPQPIDPAPVAIAMPIASTAAAVPEEIEEASLALQPQPIEAPRVVAATATDSAFVAVSELAKTLSSSLGSTLIPQPTEAPNVSDDDPIPIASASVATPEPVEPLMPAPSTPASPTAFS